jgi:hypothetical protein
MNTDERLAKKHLQLSGHKDIIFEPDGNIPPDFLVDGYIAVEVTRLNVIFDDQGQIEGVEQKRIPLVKMIKGVLQGIVVENYNHSYYVMPWYQRPLGDINKIRKWLNSHLLKIVNEQPTELIELSFNRNLKFIVKP